MIDSFLKNLGYNLALRRIEHRNVVSLPKKLSNRQVLVVMPRQRPMIDAALSLVNQIELPADQIRLVSIGDEVPVELSSEEFRISPVAREDFDWFRLPSGGICQELFAQRPHVAMDLNVEFVLPAAYLVGRSPAPFRLGIHQPEAEPFCDILVRYTGDEKEAYLALRRILYNIEPSILPMQPMSTRVFY
jgi:hypothetical protein